MALPITGVSVGEVRIDPDNGLAYRYIRFVMGGFSGTIWGPNITEFLEAYASSASFPTVNVKIGELAVDPNTGVKFRWTGSEWKLVSSIVSVGKSVTSGEIVDGSLQAADFSDSVLAESVVVLSDAAAIRNSGTTKLQVLPAPAAGFGYLVESITWRNAGGTENYAFDEMSGSRIFYLGDSTVLTNAGMMGQGSASNAFETLYHLQRPGLHAVSNNPIMLGGNGDSLTGDRVATIKIRYRLVAV